MAKTFLCCWMICLVYSVSAVTRQDVYKITQSPSYDRNEPPPPEGEPTDVKVGFYINSLNVDRKQQTVSWNIYLRQSWDDSRITAAFNDSDNHVMMGEGHWKNFWYPDTFFRNSISVSHDDRPTEHTLLRISKKGMWFVHKFHVTTSCFGLSKPGTRKKCSLMIESFKYTKDVVDYSWLPVPVDLDRAATLQGYTIVEKILYDCSQNYTAGSFPCLEIGLILRDASGIRIYSAPMIAFGTGIFLVVISWLSFWIDGDKILERLGLLVGVVITLLLLGIGLHTASDLDLPYNTYYIFIGTFVLFVVAALLEYVLAYGLLQWIPAKIKAIRKSGVVEVDASRSCAALIIDAVCGLLVFPLALVIFIIAYFSTAFM